MTRALCMFAACFAAWLPNPAHAAPTEYADPQLCALCHRKIAASYARTGMGRSFYPLTAQTAVEGFQRHNRFDHAASGEHYTMFERGGRFYQRRHQLAPGGGEINIVEKEIHFVLGSGNHSRTYLHRTPEGRLLQLPLAWYAENGGSWAMNPGYDRPDHLDFRRKIDLECFFCHNAYPAIEPGTDRAGHELKLTGPVPSGIDCQRCHGPGRAHVDAAQAARPAAEIRAAIVNPARLSATRQHEICLQCHLESTSRRLPYSVRRAGRGFFSYRPGEALEDYILHFDRAGKTGDFEIAQSGYRLMQSACFRKSAAMTCTTCHNPHQPASSNKSVCLGCHTKPHRATEDCVACHMPKRRTQDVVHAVMTDHFIRRDPPGANLLAPLTEVHDSPRTEYRGEVVLLYPNRLPPTKETELALALGQVVDGANYARGIPRLRAPLDAAKPPQTEFYFELANAYSRTDRSVEGLPYYREALRIDPRLPGATRNYAAALIATGRVADAITVLESSELDAADLNALGSAYLDADRTSDAIAALRRAQAADPDLFEVHINLGVALSRAHDTNAAVAELTAAVRDSPNSPVAHDNLASALAQHGDFPAARKRFESAILLDPNRALTHYNFGHALARQKLFPEAEREFSAALRLDTRFAEAAFALAVVFEDQGRWPAALEHYRKAIAIRPAYRGARLQFAVALVRRHEWTEARSQVEAVLRADPNDKEAKLILARIPPGR
jgi:tetratricopeptide (TPR) repeat protein